MTGETPDLTLYDTALLLKQAGETGLTTTQIARRTSAEEEKEVKSRGDE